MKRERDREPYSNEKAPLDSRGILHRLSSGGHSRSRLQGDEVVWVAGSTRNGEEAVILDVYEKMASSFPNSLLIVACLVNRGRAGSSPLCPSFSTTSSSLFTLFYFLSYLLCQLLIPLLFLLLSSLVPLHVTFLLPLSTLIPPSHSHYILSFTSSSTSFSNLSWSASSSSSSFRHHSFPSS